MPAHLASQKQLEATPITIQQGTASKKQGREREGIDDSTATAFLIFSGLAHQHAKAS